MTTDVISEVRFTNCTIVGPAVIILMGNSSMTHTSLDSADALWPFPDDRQYLVGVLGFTDCHFVNCQLQRLGIAVPQNLLGKMREGFGLQDT